MNDVIPFPDQRPELEELRNEAAFELSAEARAVYDKYDGDPAKLEADLTEARIAWETNQPQASGQVISLDAAREKREAKGTKET